MTRFDQYSPDMNSFADVIEVSQPQKTQFSFLHFHPRRKQMIYHVARRLVFVDFLCANEIEDIQFYE